MYRIYYWCVSGPAWHLLSGEGLTISEATSQA